jgi:hypothetical protein
MHNNGWSTFDTANSGKDVCCDQQQFTEHMAIIAVDQRR